MASRNPRTGYEFDTFPEFGSERGAPRMPTPTQPTGPRGAPTFSDTGATYPQYPWTPTATMMQDAPAPAAPSNPFAGGSPLNTLYGVDSESYLTEDQRKLARMIQGKFDASLNRRDRALAQYGAPRLSSFAEDEALARAMSLARGLNYKDPDVYGSPTGGVGSPRVGGSSGGGGGGGSARSPAGSQLRVPSASTQRAPTAPASKSPFSQWQQIAGGLASLAPLLFGKDAYGNFLNKGLLGTIKDAVFGKELAPMIDDRVLEQMVTTGNLPDAGGFLVNPITGMPIAPSPYAPPDIYGPGSGWGEDVIQAPEFVPPSDFVGPPVEWAGPDWSGWWDDNYWYPDWGGAGDWFTPDDPFGVGGW